MGGLLQVAADGPAKGVEAQGEDVVAEGDEPAPAGWSGPPWEQQRQGRAGKTGHKRVTRNGWGGVGVRKMGGSEKDREGRRKGVSARMEA